MITFSWDVLLNRKFIQWWSFENVLQFRKAPSFHRSIHPTLRAMILFIRLWRCGNAHTTKVKPTFACVARNPGILTLLIAHWTVIFFICIIWHYIILLRKGLLKTWRWHTASFILKRHIRNTRLQHRHRLSLGRKRTINLRDFPISSSIILHLSENKIYLSRFLLRAFPPKAPPAGPELSIMI